MNRLIFISIIFLFSFLKISKAQDSLYSRNSIRTGLKLGVFSASLEEGVGAMPYVGYQRDYRRFRLAYELAAGTFRPIATDTRDQFFRVTSLAVNASMNLIKIKAFSVFAGLGTSINYSRGLRGTGGYRDETYYNTSAWRESSDYFYKIYAAGSGHFGFRFVPTEGRISTELSLINVAIGTGDMEMEYLSFGIGIKLKSRKNK